MFPNLSTAFDLFDVNSNVVAYVNNGVCLRLQPDVPALRPHGYSAFPMECFYVAGGADYLGNPLSVTS